MAKNMNKNTTREVTSINEVVFDALKPVSIDFKNQTYLKNLYNSIVRETEKINGTRNWAVRDIALSIPGIDTDYQRIPTNSEIAKIYNNFDMNKVDIKLVSIRKDENGKYHLYVIDGYHTLVVLRMMAEKYPEMKISFTAKAYINLTKEQEADIFSSQNENNTNIRGYERYKSELVAKKPCAMAIQHQLSKFGLTTKVDIGSQTNRVHNVNAIEELYRIFRRYGEAGLNYTFQLIEDAGWRDSTWAYKQRTLGGLSCTFNKGQEANARARLLCAMSAVDCKEFLAMATSEIGGGAGDHYSDKVKNYCLDLMG